MYPRLLGHVYLVFPDLGTRNMLSIRLSVMDSSL